MILLFNRVWVFDPSIGSTVDTLNKGISETGFNPGSPDDTQLLDDIFDNIYDDIIKEQNDEIQNRIGVAGIHVIISAVCIILWACLQIYFFICIHSFYKKIRDGKITSAA